LEYIDRLILGNSMDVLPQLPGESVQMVATSPPYYGLRKYDGEPVMWQPADACEHEWDEERLTEADGHLNKGFNERWGHSQGQKKQEKMRLKKYSQGQFCVKCGAWYGMLGLEPSPELYISHLVSIFREVRRVLRKDGIVFLNIADSYWGGKGQSGYELPHEAEARRAAGETIQHAHNVPGYMNMRPSDGKHPNIKPKDLIGIPWMLAMALRDDGWWLRSTIIWKKPNCLCGSTLLYAKTQRSEGPMTLKDLVRLHPSTVKLWNGSKWTQVTSWTPNLFKEKGLKITLRSGEIIKCTGDHVWPTKRGNVRASGDAR
jgi:DNA modification methylase